MTHPRIDDAYAHLDGTTYAPEARNTLASSIDDVFEPEPDCSGWAHRPSSPSLLRSFGDMDATLRFGNRGTRTPLSESLDPAPSLSSSRSSLASSGGHPGAAAAAAGTQSTSRRLTVKVDDRDTVRMLDDPTERARKYRVTIGHKLLRRGQDFDTREIKQHFKGKESRSQARQYGNTQGGKSSRLGMFHLGSDHQQAAAFIDIARYWSDHSLIWVCADAGRGPEFFSHVGKQNRFHHSTFFARGDLVGAGEWIVEKGVLLRISANSGHYQPTLGFLLESVRLMGAGLNGETTVLLWNMKLGKWEDRSAQHFLRDPQADTYCAHPASGPER